MHQKPETVINKDILNRPTSKQGSLQSKTASNGLAQVTTKSAIMEGVTPAVALSDLPHYAFLKQATTSNKLRIVVLHGDPTKPNDILPGGKWDEDDFYTIARAKEAMKELEDRYEFTWLCNHDTLMDDLRQLKQEDKVDLVLQLCDEGWMNNSRMELHVTAFLEMVGIPYSGAGPKTIGITYGKIAG
jgi:D-alanine-D-alanine ligase